MHRCVEQTEDGAQLGHSWQDQWKNPGSWTTGVPTKSFVIHTIVYTVKLLFIPQLVILLILQHAIQKLQATVLPY